MDTASSDAGLTRTRSLPDGRLARDAFAPPALDVARSLIGCTLRRGECAGVIVETEAYADDAASHAVTRTPSAGKLLGTTHGLAYVYLIYGMHLCLNVTADASGAGAVLLRAIEPTDGLALMRQRRGAVADRDLCRGPGRLAQSFGVTREMSGEEFLSLFDVERHAGSIELTEGPRVGISRATELPWRISLAGSRFVSAPRPGAALSRK